jgi:CHAP domain
VSEWYEIGYPGGPMVAVKGFPRPLYPPDAAPGHSPSVDGPDVEAYKRTISRAGRWEWQAFDQAMSNSFSHGKAGGNVGESGVEGVQRQAKIQPTGWIGKETFNLLRSIRIPEGLPNAGQTAMDARSVELLNAAFDRFKGKEPDPDGGSAAKTRLTRAEKQLGYKESPAGTNQNKFGDWYGMNGQPWCAIFCTWCDQTGGAPTASFKRGSRYAYVPYVVSDARLGKNGLAITSSPKPGDLVCYDWARDGEHDHIGIVQTPPDSRGTFWAIEGNTSIDNNSNGGQVMQRSRSVSGQGTVFVRVAEP